MGNRWPLILRDGELTLRPLRIRDRRAWLDLRKRNRQWLTPWEATSPLPAERKNLPTFVEMISHYNREAKAGRTYSLAISVDGLLVGQINLGGVAYGAYRGAHIGYWIDQGHANRGLITRAVLLVTKFAFEELQLHRIEISCRPENSASKRVAEKAGYRFEGLRSRFLHIDGAWRDHLVFVMENPRL